MSTKCPNCGTEAFAGAAFCDNCGTSLAGTPAAPSYPPAAPTQLAGSSQICPNCHTPAMAGEAFCGNCGTPLGQAAPAPPAYQQPPAYQPAPVYQPPPPYQPPAQQPPPVYQPPAQQPPAYQPQQPAATQCPQCGQPIVPGSAFCDSCGAALTGAAPVTPPPYPSVTPPPPPASPGVTPRLVVQATNTPLNFPVGKAEVLIGREDPVSGHFPDVDLNPHGGEAGGVSRSHAKLMVQGGNCFVEDLNSVNFTFVNRQKLNPGVRHPVNNGDELRFGKVVVMFYMA